MNLIEAIDKLITERGSATVLDKHLAFIKDQVQFLTKQNEALEKENSNLKTQLSEALDKIKSNSSSDEFIEHKGSLFKKDPKGGYAESVYCPRCKFPMASSFSGFPYQCIPCKHISQIKNGQLLALLNELPPNP